MGELQVGPTVAFGLAQERVKRLGHGADLQGLQVVQQELAVIQLRRRRTAA